MLISLDAHFVKVMSDTVSYVQVTGNGDFSKINVSLPPRRFAGLSHHRTGLMRFYRFPTRTKVASLT